MNELVPQLQNFFREDCPKYTVSSRSGEIFTVSKTVWVKANLKAISQDGRHAKLDVATEVVKAMSRTCENFANATELRGELFHLMVLAINLQSSYLKFSTGAAFCISYLILSKYMFPSDLSQDEILAVFDEILCLPLRTWRIYRPIMEALRKWSHVVGDTSNMLNNLQEKLLQQSEFGCLDFDYNVLSCSVAIIRGPDGDAKTAVWNYGKWQDVNILGRFKLGAIRVKSFVLFAGTLWYQTETNVLYVKNLNDDKEAKVISKNCIFVRDLDRMITIERTPKYDILSSYKTLSDTPEKRNLFFTKIQSVCEAESSDRGFVYTQEGHLISCRVNNGNWTLESTLVITNYQKAYWVNAEPWDILFIGTYYCVYFSSKKKKFGQRFASGLMSFPIDGGKTMFRVTSGVFPYQNTEVLNDHGRVIATSSLHPPIEAISTTTLWLRKTV